MSCAIQRHTCSVILSQSAPTRCCPTVQANVEQLFSRSGNLSDPNMDPEYLAILTSIGINKKVYKPSLSEIKDMYYQMFRGKGVDGGAASSSAAGPSTPVSSSAIRSSGGEESP